MAKFRVFGNKTEEITELELKNRELSLKVASEGIVLLKNNNVLPFNDKKIAAYGAGVRLTIKGGTGSGDVLERYSVNIEQGLKNHGIEVLSTKWLDRFDKTYEQEKQAWIDDIERQIKKYKIWEVQKMFDEVINPAKLSYPVGDLINQDDLCDTDVALYIVSRQAGEASDRRLEKGDYYLSDIEVANIKTIRKHYKKVILVINSGSIVDLSSINEDDIDALIYMGQAGEEGGNALAKILIGEVNPSGKLSDTWPIKYEDVPFSNEFGINGNVLEQNYKEGIYVGYRYYDSFNVKARYYFGYGLSYTKFDIKYLSINHDKSNINVKVEVVNSGDKYDGKEVVQLYLEKPHDKFVSEKKSLVAFAKTNLLKVHEKQEILLSFNLEDFAIYDENNSQYILPKGTYTLLLGNASNNVRKIAYIKLDEDIITEKCEGVVSDINFDELKADIVDETTDSKLDVVCLSKNDFATITHIYKKPQLKIKNHKTEEFLNKLSDIDLIDLTVGGGYSGLGYNVCPTVAGRTSINLIKKGIPEVNLSDGPAGLRLYPKNAYTSRGGLRYVDNIPENWNWGWIKKIGKLFVTKSKKGIRVYQYLTAFPCALLQAQTFNIDLIQDVGFAIGEEMILTGVTAWLAPGMNIHRNPLCGRNFEYYSEDPLLSGLMASSVTKGVQSHKGLVVTIKHFCCNNQEDKREYMSSNVKERALREIYLKGFRIAIKESNPGSLMTSYNCVNHVYMPNNYDLVTKVLNNEWNYQGLVMTDWTATGEGKGKHELCHLTGNHLIEPGGKGVKKQLLEAYKENKLDMDLIKVAASKVLDLIFNSNVSEIK